MAACAGPSPATSKYSRPPALALSLHPLDDVFLLSHVFTKFGGVGDRFADYLCVNCANTLRKWTQSTNKHEIHHTYYQHV